ncbi:MAG: UDP-N-acetylmuramate dehydrogenase [Clostridiales bacterium]|jgi:UDP-N-acetylmuramate dehydrogenase|nr:UDP-N-acetylmuramate dehydrogenase [Clostridiales bacterium]
MGGTKPLSRYTTYRIGGPAEVYEIREAAQAEALFTGGEIVLGGGSNVLAADAGTDRRVLINRLSGIVINGNRVYAGSGTFLPKLAAVCADAGFSGLEWAGGIPGTVGGAVCINAGAFGGAIADVLLYADVLEDGKQRRYGAADCRFSYRRSRFTDQNTYITGACFLLKHGDPDAIAALGRAYQARRRLTQPVGRSAGSVFKAADRPAGWYIDRAGLKGLSVGGAVISDKHANFILNTGGAAAGDVLALMRRIEETVFQKFHVMLEREIRLIGEF